MRNLKKPHSFTVYVAALTLILVVLLCVAGRADVLPPPWPAPSIILPPPPARFGTTEMPLEVLGVEGTTKTALVWMRRPAALMTMQVHGLENPQEGSVRVGAGPWVPLDNSGVVQVAEPGRSYGGIGGGFATLTLTLPVRVRPGLALVSFRFNHTDGVNFGFRVLKFNFLDSRGQAILPPSTFRQHDPATESAPLTDRESITSGRLLWHSAQLVPYPGGSFIKASCADCHAQDGRDLKYYGYTNNAVYERCLFHSLTHGQAQQITSYIRTLPVSVAGRPWNPPYQPGPGLDSKPISAWAAGAGLDAVLGSDAEMLPYLFPQGISKVGIGANDTLNMRELPIALQLPDWNHWLPRIAPLDAWGDVFTQSAFAQFYDGAGPSRFGSASLRAALSNPDAGYHAFITSAPGAVLPQMLGAWSGQDYSDFIHAREAQSDGTAAYQEKLEASAKWGLVKTWELMQEFGLEGNAALIFPTAPGTPTAGESRSWLSEAAFLVSPAFDGLQEDGSFYSRVQYEYLANAWYYTQMVVNSGNRHRNGFHPVDWGYAVGRAGDLSQASGQPSTLRMTAMLIKGMQQSDTNGTVDTTYGWFPHFAGDLRYFYWENAHPQLTAFSPDTATTNKIYGQIITAVAQAQFDKMKTHTRAEYQASTQGGENSVVYGGDSLFNEEKETLVDLNALGIDKTLIRSRADWDKTVWGDFGWDSLKP